MNCILALHPQNGGQSQDATIYHAAMSTDIASLNHACGLRSGRDGKTKGTEIDGAKEKHIENAFRSHELSPAPSLHSE